MPVDRVGKPPIEHRKRLLARRRRMDLALGHDVVRSQPDGREVLVPLRPRRDPLDVDLGMELDGEVRAEAEGRGPRGGLRQLETARRHAHLLGVPHEPRATGDQTTVDRLDGEPADLGPVEHVDPATERQRQGLPAEAQSEHRHARVDGRAQSGNLRRYPRGIRRRGGVLRAKRDHEGVIRRRHNGLRAGVMHHVRQPALL